MKCCMRGCPCGRKIVIDLLKGEIVYDVRNTAYIYADTINVDDPHRKHNIYDIGEEGNRDKLARIMDVAVEDCREMLYRFTKTCLERIGYDSNEWEECVGSPENDEEGYSLTLLVPSNFSDTSVHTIGVYVHNYVVNRIMYQWLMLVYPEGAESFAVLAAELESKIRDASNRSMGRTRIKLHPF